MNSATFAASPPSDPGVGARLRLPRPAWTRLAVLLAVALGLPCRAAPALVEAQIREAEARINAAYAANDLPHYFAAYDESLRALFPDGATTLPRYRKDWTAFIEGGGAIVSFDYSDLVIQVAPSEDAAVASYRAKVQTRGQDGKVSVETYLETDVFFRRDQEWKIVEVHYSPLAAAGS